MRSPCSNNTAQCRKNQLRWRAQLFSVLSSSKLRSTKALQDVQKIDRTLCCCPHSICLCPESAKRHIVACGIKRFTPGTPQSCCCRESCACTPLPPPSKAFADWSSLSQDKRTKIHPQRPSHSATSTMDTSTVGGSSAQLQRAGTDLDNSDTSKLHVAATMHVSHNPDRRLGAMALTYWKHELRWYCDYRAKR